MASSQQLWDLLSSSFTLILVSCSNLAFWISLSLSICCCWNLFLILFFFQTFFSHKNAYNCQLESVLWSIKFHCEIKILFLVLYLSANQGAISTTVYCLPILFAVFCTFIHFFFLVLITLFSNSFTHVWFFFFNSLIHILSSSLAFLSRQFLNNSENFLL